MVRDGDKTDFSVKEAESLYFQDSYGCQMIKS